jgi:hypothetical protein
VERLTAEAGHVRREIRVLGSHAASTVRPVTHDGYAQVGEVDPDLVRPSGSQGNLEERERCRAREPLEDPIAGERGTAGPGGANRHAEPVSRVSADRGLDHARSIRKPTVHQRQVAALHAPRRQLARERLMRVIGLGNDEEPGGPTVQPVHDTWSPSAADARERRAAVRQESVDERPCPVARTRVYHEPSGLVHHQEVGILVDDVDRDRLGHDRHSLGGRHVDQDARPGPQAVARPGLASHHVHLAGQDQRLKPRA